MGKISITLLLVMGFSTILWGQSFQFKGLETKFRKSELELCLQNEKQVQKCIQTKIKILSIESCFTEALKLKSDFLKEETLQFCFYQVSEFPSIESCEKRAVLFSSAENHDEALFECARQSQLSMTQKNCESLAQKMRYPEKSKYLIRQCSLL